MREIELSIVKETLKDLIARAAFELPGDVVKRLQNAGMQETCQNSRSIINQILENADIATREHLPLCQDCGLAILFLEVGQEVHFTGGDLCATLNEGVREAYREHYLRKSVVADPLSRTNTGDNTPAVIYTDIVPGDQVRLRVMLKGGGCENMSYIRMLTPGEGLAGIKKFVLESVSRSGANPCPPIVVGVGIGGNFEQAALLAKKSLLKDLGTTNPLPELAKIEEDLLEKINKLGIGPMGMGGDTTALAVKILAAPCHIASLPVAVNIECHSHRHREAII